MTSATLATMDSIVVGRSARMRAVFEYLRVIGNSDSTVLVTGESGTGKELVAGALHANSRRKTKKENWNAAHQAPLPRRSRR